MKLALKLVIPGVISLALFATTPGCCSTCKDGDSETPVMLSDLPAAVKATLDKETAGGQVTKSTREVEDGKTVYAFDAKVGGKNWDIEIAEDGTLVSKKEE